MLRGGGFGLWAGLMAGGRVVYPDYIWVRAVYTDRLTGLQDCYRKGRSTDELLWMAGKEFSKAVKICMFVIV